MQRAAAQDRPQSGASTPDGQPAKKRMRMSNGNSTPMTPDAQRLQAAQEQEELKHKEVMDRIAAEAGETRWVLSVKEPPVQSSGPIIIHTGFADIDAASEDDQSDEDDGIKASKTVPGRMMFGTVRQIS